jgi:hypothetical protein
LNQELCSLIVLITVDDFFTLPTKHLTLRKCRVARKSGESVSCAFAHCSANGVKASRQSWQTSELILIIEVKEQTTLDILDLDQVIPSIKCMTISRNEYRSRTGDVHLLLQVMHPTNEKSFYSLLSRNWDKRPSNKTRHDQLGQEWRTNFGTRGQIP